MKTSNFTTVILKADANCFLTNADPETDILDRIVADTIAIGKYDSAENYIEIDAETAEQYRKEIAEAYEAQRLAEEERMKAEAEVEIIEEVEE